MAVVVQMFGFGGLAVFATIAFKQTARLQFAAVHLGVEQVEDAFVEAEMRTQREGNLRILQFQTLDLRFDTFDQNAGNRYTGMMQICVMPSFIWRCTTISRRGQVTPVKARSTSS